jgi:putative phage-type endonuclease
MRTLELKQNTPMWELYRRNHIGASDSPTICGVNPFKTPYKLWKEKMSGEIPHCTPAMIDGMIYEKDARLFAEEHFDMEFSPVCILHDEHDYLMASLDGFNAEKFVSLEVKVVGHNTYDKIEKEGPVQSWIYQINHQMECLGPYATSAYLYVMNKENGFGRAFTIKKDECIVREILEKANDFYGRMLNFDPPKDTHVEREDEMWQQLAQQFLKAKEAKEKAESSLEEVRAAIIHAAGEESCRGFGVTATKCLGPSRIDYSNIPELKTIDLNKYKKPGKETWRVA